MRAVPEVIGPGLTLHGYCCRCGVSVFDAAQIPVCGWCALRELHADQTWQRYRSPSIVDAAKSALRNYSNETLQTNLLIDCYELRSLRKRVEHQTATPEWVTA